MKGLSEGHKKKKPIYESGRKLIPRLSQEKLQHPLFYAND